MAQKRVVLYGDTSGQMVADTANTKGALVTRDPSDGSVNHGPTNTNEVNNTGGTFNQVANYTTTATLEGLETNATVDGASGAFTLTLPAVAGAAGQEFKISRKATANAVTIKGSGSEAIVSNGVSANTFVLSAPGQAISLFCDGANWYVSGVACGSLETAIADPGASGAIAVTSSGNVQIVTAGSESRTLAAPSFLGQQMLISMKTHGGDCAITCSTTIDQSAHTVITLNTAGDAVLLIAKQNGSNIRWSVAMNDGAALT